MVRKKHRVDPELTDDENPELTDEMAARARPARDVLREQFGEAATAEMLNPNPRGRPRLARPKVLRSLYFSQDVIDYFKSTGKGWQSRIDEVLREWVRGQIP